MEFVEQLVDTVEAPAQAKKPAVWSWVPGGLALAGGLVWMASASTRKPNPVDSGIEARIAEARDPETSWDRLWVLSAHPKTEVRQALLDNPTLCHANDQHKLDTSLLHRLSRHLPEKVAAHPLFVLHALIEPQEEMQEVVNEVAKRTEDVGLIERLWSTWGPSSAGVRQAVAENPNTPTSVLQILGNIETESDWIVRRAVAMNANTPGETLRLLSNPDIEPKWEVRIQVASNFHAPVDVLHVMGNQKTESMSGLRNEVAKNHRTPVDVLQILGNQKTESETYVRKSVTLNPNTPNDLLRFLCNQKSESSVDVRQSAQKALATRGLV